MAVPPSRPGYTLLEVILVVAIIAMVTAVAYPSLEAMYGYYKVTAAVDAVRGAWAQARAHAIEEGRPYRFAVIAGSGKFRIAPDVPSYWSGGGAPDGENGYVLEDELPKGVRFTVNASDSGVDQPQDQGGSGDWSGAVSFLSDGTASLNLEVLFEVEGARPMMLQLRALTGTVAVKTLRPEEVR
jgi:prepilin-type N-terminal cleavage/methylation domain-containing protein